jgi:hypothetical protein
MHVVKYALLAAGLSLAANGVLAQAITLDLTAERTVQISDNRRNPGEMAPIALGDVDGDGLSDLVMGAPRAAGFTTIDSGMVYVRYGGDYFALPPASDDGGMYYDFTARPDFTANPLESAVTFGDSLARVPSGVQIFPERGGEYFGAALATGDFNGDNFTDIAITATNPLGEPKIGSVYIVLGRADLAGITAVDSEIFNGDAVEIRGRQAGSRFGEVLHFADINNDNYDDLVIGTPRAGIGGTVDIVYGRPNFGFSRSDIDGVPPPVTRVVTTITEERFGSSFAHGDFNNDGFPELMIGAPRWPVPAQSRGRVLVMNLAGAQPTSVNLSLTPPYFQIQGTIDQWGVGGSLAVGDLNGDSVLDAVVGAPFATRGASSNVGRVLSVSDPARFAGGSAALPGDAGVHIRGITDQEFFGQAIAVADYDGAPGVDLFVGAPGAFAGPVQRAGGLFIYRGGVLPDGEIAADEPGYPITRMNVPFANYRLGTHIAVGQFDGNNRNDFFVSGDGRLPMPPRCFSETLADYLFCHNNRESIRVYGGLAGTLIQPPIALEAKDSWLLAP